MIVDCKETSSDLCWVTFWPTKVPVDGAWVTAVGTNIVAPNAGAAGGANAGVVACAAGGATAAT